MKTYKGSITELPENGIFVFGSNTQGRHGAGAALVAREKFGAIYGQSTGLQGKSYGIVTKDLTKSVHPSIPEQMIMMQIWDLYKYAEVNHNKLFYIAYSGNGINLNAYTPQDMARMFSYVHIPENIIFEEEFYKLLKPPSV
jgi:hypothetical protein